MASAIVVILTSMFVFALFFLGPTDPARPLCDLNGKCTPEKLQVLTEEMGFDKPVTQQYLVWAKGVFAGREINMGAHYKCPAPCLGISYSDRKPVSTDLKDKYPATLSLALGGAAIYLVVGVVLGTLAAKFRGSAVDRGLVGASLVINAIPYYVVALLAWIYLSLQWGIFPDTSYHPISHGVFAWFWGLLLPWLVLGLTNSTQYARFSRGQMVETLGEDYIRTGTAKGLTQNRVLFKHALRAAIVPVITIFGLDLAGLLAGTIFTETIFDIDGMGRWAIKALKAPVDFPVVAATVLVAAVIVVLANLIVDILYSIIDPRVRLS
jgi:peptide/nickel transport system permease protein